MKKLNYIFLLFLLSGQTACEKEADIKLEEIPPTPVIEGRISTNHNDSYLKITMTKGFNRESYQYEYITDAQIEIKDEQGNIIPFYLNDGGFFVTDEDALPETKYFIDVQFDNYQVTGEEQILNIPEIAGIGGSYLLDEVSMDIIDPNDKTDYYIIELQILNNNNYAGSYWYLLNDNEKINGIFYFSNVNLNPGNKIIAIVKHIPKNYYDYIVTLFDIGDAGYGQSPFNTTVLGNPVSNLSTGIGFWGSSAINKKELQLPD